MKLLKVHSETIDFEYELTGGNFNVSIRPSCSITPGIGVDAEVIDGPTLTAPAAVSGIEEIIKGFSLMTDTPFRSIYLFFLHCVHARQISRIEVKYFASKASFVQERLPVLFFPNQQHQLLYFGGVKPHPSGRK